MCFTYFIAANIFLTLINRSFYYSIFTTLKYKNNLVLMIIFITIAVVGLILYIKPLSSFFEFKSLNVTQLSICIAVGLVSVVWMEIVKWIKRARSIGDKSSQG